MGDKENNPHRLIRPYQETDKTEVVGVWHRFGIAAYTYLPTWQALTLETATDYIIKLTVEPI